MYACNILEFSKKINPGMVNLYGFIRLYRRNIFVSKWRTINLAWIKYYKIRIRVIVHCSWFNIYDSTFHSVSETEIATSVTIIKWKKINIKVIYICYNQIIHDLKIEMIKQLTVLCILGIFISYSIPLMLE